MKPDYMSKIGPVAESLAHVPTYEQRVLDAWRKYEQLAGDLKPAPRDILSTTCTGWRALHEHTERFVNLLYENMDATWEEDVAQIRKKNAEYGESWCARGGDGAFHALARKGDRIVSILKEHGTFVNARAHSGSESIDDTLGDLRRYFILVLAWHEAAERVDAFYGATGGSGYTADEAIEEDTPPAPKSTCPKCSHLTSEHDSDGCNHYDAQSGQMCECDR